MTPEDISLREGLGRWLTDRHPDLAPIDEVWAISGGRSNLVHGVQLLDGVRYCLRRPSSASPGAGNGVLREAAILHALTSSDVPVPAVLGTSDDPGYVGTSFAVLEFVNGRAYDTPAAVAALDMEARFHASREMARAVAVIHRVELAQTGIGDMSPSTPFTSRQLRRWREQLTPDDVSRDPLLATVHDQLQSSAPEQTRRGLLHGDFKIGNCMLDESGSLVAVLDWELSSTGDPRADVGWLLASWSERAD
jgi:aminoglycoside phosphotransferase (APT) family kinase protein